MSETEHYGLLLAITAAVALAAVLSNRLTERIKIPVPLLMLAGSAVAAAVVGRLHAPGHQTVERIVTAALVLILFDGGMHIGWKRFREAAAPIAIVGVVGTFLTAAAGALLLHAVFGLGWYVALLVATAVAPTDPAVVFSVLGRREIAGRSGTILEGESGANDPVGIALMGGLVAAGSLTGGAVLHVAVEFLLQMAIGGAFGLVGARALLWFMRRVPLPSEGLYPLRTLACAFLLYGLATVAHGSGFLAVFVAGILIGDATAPYKREAERFHAALASLAEIVAFVVLGLTVDLHVLARADVWVPGLVLGIVLAAVIRPVLVGSCVLPARLRPNERTFVLFAGLKGAVPILLGQLLSAAHVPDAGRLYGIIVVVVAFSVLVQGSLVPAATEYLRLPMRTTEPEPWALGVRLLEEPGGVLRLNVDDGSTVDGVPVDQLPGLVGDVWVSIILRDQQLVPLRGQTVLRAGDDVILLATPDVQRRLGEAFRRPEALRDPEALRRP
jgi:cell volume regulation protein A